MKILFLILVICLPIGACHSIFDVPETDQNLPEDNTKPGKKLVIPHTDVWILESCGSRKLPYLRLDQTEIVPKTIKAGNLMRYRLSYTACIPQKTPYLPGRLKTQISFKGNIKNVRSDDSYSIETGKWVVDTHIIVPKDAEIGTYVLETALSIKGERLQDYVSFNVER